jgi:hypothetical protein
MKKYAVKTDEGHFNWIKAIGYDVQKLGAMFQNENMTVTAKDVAEFHERISEVKNQLVAWHLESTLRITKIKSEGEI